MPGSLLVAGPRHRGEVALAGICVKGRPRGAAIGRQKDVVEKDVQTIESDLELRPIFPPHRPEGAGPRVAEHAGALVGAHAGTQLPEGWLAYHDASLLRTARIGELQPRGNWTRRAASLRCHRVRRRAARATRRFGIAAPGARLRHPVARFYRHPVALAGPLHRELAWSRRSLQGCPLPFLEERPGLERGIAALRTSS